MISVSKYNAHTDPIFKNLNILKIEDIATRKLYQRYIINKLPDYFTINFNIQQQQSSHQYNTRHHRFMIPRVHHKFAEYTACYQLPLLLNKNVECILDKVLTHSEYGFSQYIKKVPDWSICRKMQHPKLLYLPNYKLVQNYTHLPLTQHIQVICQFIYVSEDLN